MVIPSDDSERGTSPRPSVDRCQFTFSDGRQCRNHRSQLCAHHASKAKLKRDAEGFPDAPIEAPELQALCVDLTTATNINRALARTFLLLAQGRISRKDAVAFGYLSQLLLQTVPGIRSEFVAAFGWTAWDAHLESTLTIRPGSPSRANSVSEGSLSGQRTPVESSQHDEGRSPNAAHTVNAPAGISQPPSRPPTPSSKPPKTRPVPGAPLREPQATTPASPPAPAAPTDDATHIVLLSEHREPKDLSVSSPSRHVPMKAPPTLQPHYPAPEPTATPSLVSAAACSLSAPAPRLPDPPAEDYFAPPRRHPEREMPVTTLDWLPPRSKTPPEPVYTKADKFARRIGKLSNFGLRHLLHFQHSKAAE